jgi:transcriptional regulator GlxA family with amidase domain
MDSSLTITLDTLRAAQALSTRARKRAGVRWSVAAQRRTVTTRGGLRLTVNTTFAEPQRTPVRAEWLIVPGLGLTSEGDIDACMRRGDALAAIELLRDPRVAKNIAASCSAVFLVAQAGLLSGRSATTTWWLSQAFRERHRDVQLDESRMLVRDGRLLTAGSAYAQLDLVLAVIAESMGPEVAHLCSSYMLIDRRASQARYMIPSHIRHVDETVLAAERWIEKNLARPITITALASALAVSAKTLARRISAATGASPIRFVQRRRLTEAVHLIETTTLPLDTIAAQVGYQDATALRKIIRRELGVPPSALRG